MKMLMVLIHVWHRFFSVFCEASYKSSSTAIAQNAFLQKNILTFAVIEHHGGFGCNPLISRSIAGCEKLYLNKVVL